MPLPPQQQTEERSERLAGVARRMREITTSWGLALVLLHDSPDGEMHVRMRSNMVTSAGIGNDSFCEVRPKPDCPYPVETRLACGRHPFCFASDAVFAPLPLRLATTGCVTERVMQSASRLWYCACCGCSGA